MAELFVLAIEQRVATHGVDRAMLGGGHQPGARIIRHARLRPLLERRDECVLREILGETDVAHDARQTGDQLRRFDSPDCVDRAVCVGGRHASYLAPLSEFAALPQGRGGTSVALAI